MGPALEALRDLWSVPAVVSLAALLAALFAVLRRGLAGSLPYAVLLAGNTVAATVVLFGDRVVREDGRPTPELLLSTAACVVLVLVPALVSRSLRRAFAEERFERAARLAVVLEILQPGRRKAAERALYEQLAEARRGDVDRAVAALRHELVSADPAEEDALKERIALLYVVAGRNREAITQFETHLARDPARFPALAIRMVTVYGEEDDLARAAELLAHLEETVNPLDPTGRVLLVSARLALLAEAGQLAAVERVLAMPALARLVPRDRARLVETARRHAGRAEAIAERARAEAAAQARDRVEGGGAGELGETEGFARFLAEVATRAADGVRKAPRPDTALPRATLSLVGLNVAAWIAFTLLVGPHFSGEQLLRAGASFHPAVRAGEWFRLVTALFLHDGGLHLFLNMYGLYLLGRLVEPALGSARFLVLYMAAGVAGNVVSAWNPNPAAAFSLGASGAVLGVMGALVVTVSLRRTALPERLRRGLLVNLSLLLAVEIAVGFNLPVVDNLAHLGGLAGGALAAFVLSPGGLLSARMLGRRAESIARVVVGLLGLAALGAALSSLVSLVREDPARTIARLPRARLSLGAISLELPAGSHLFDDPGEEPALLDRAAGLRIQPRLVISPDGVTAVLAEAVASDRKGLASDDAGKGGLVVEAAAAPPFAGWTESGQRGRDKQLAVTELYYARPLDAAHAHQTVLVRFGRIGDGPPPPAVVQEIARALDSVRVAPEAFVPPPFAAPPPTPRPSTPPPSTTTTTTVTPSGARP